MAGVSPWEADHLPPVPVTCLVTLSSIHSHFWMSDNEIPAAKSHQVGAYLNRWAETERHLFSLPHTPVPHRPRLSVSGPFVCVFVPESLRLPAKEQTKTGALEANGLLTMCGSSKKHACVLEGVTDYSRGGQFCCFEGPHWVFDPHKRAGLGGAGN